MRAGGAGFQPSTHHRRGNVVAEGGKKFFNGRECVLEQGIVADFALVKA